jgi:hypothetical protein
VAVSIRRFQKRNGRYVGNLTVSEATATCNGIPPTETEKCPFGCNGYVTAVAAGLGKWFYSGVGIFDWYYSDSTINSAGGTTRNKGTDVCMYLYRTGYLCTYVVCMS